MIYAVNRKTREHRVVTWQDNDFVDMGWDLVEADADGWIDHDGRGCPLPPDQPVECKDKHGAVTKFSAAGSVIGWIKAVKQYRPILNHPGQPKEWRGPEDGLPPVGTVCEYRLGDSVNWFACKIVMHVGTQGTVMERSDIFEGIQYCSANGNQAVHFRPIRTDRERWIDECVDIFVNHYGNPKGSESYIGIATKIHDALQRGELTVPEDA